MLNNSSARAHLKAKIPTNINQKGTVVTTSLKDTGVPIEKNKIIK